MLYLTVIVTDEDRSVLETDDESRIQDAKNLLAVLENFQVGQGNELNLGFTFCEDGNNNLYTDVRINVTSQFKKNSYQYFLSPGGLAVNVQPLIDMLQPLKYM